MLPEVQEVLEVLVLLLEVLVDVLLEVGQESVGGAPGGVFSVGDVGCAGDARGGPGGGAGCC